MAKGKGITTIIRESAQGDGPSWADFAAAIRGQFAEFSELIANSEERNDRRFNEIVALVKDTNETTRSYIDVLEAKANQTHKEINRRVDQNFTITRNLLGGAVIVITAMIGLIVWLAQQWLITAAAVAAAK